MATRFLRILLALLLIGETIVPGFIWEASAASWDSAHAEYLARKVLFAPTSSDITSLTNAWSASAAVNILFPDVTGPSRTQYNSEISTLTSTSGFNWGDGGWMARLYQYKYARDPYEAKRKLFSLFEDIFSVNVNGSSITYKDVHDQQELVYSYTLGNYRSLVKHILYNNGSGGDYAEGKFLDLLDQTNKNYPNENYARELLQLFLMGEYEPGKSKDAWDVRNYLETDVAALAKVLTGLKSDSVAHTVSYNVSMHNTSTGVVFLSGASTGSFPFYNSASGTLNLATIDAPILWNNGLTDNTIDYIFSKRSPAIARFLAARIYGFYLGKTPEDGGVVEPLAQNILANDFEILPSVKFFLASDAFYDGMNSTTALYKNPLELTIGTLKILHANDGNQLDPLLYADTSLFYRFGWNPYYPGSVFGRDGFDNNVKWYSAYLENQWITYANRIAYTTGTGTYSLSWVAGPWRTSNTSPFSFTSTGANTYSGTVALWSGTGVVNSVANTPLSSPVLTLPNMTITTSSGVISVFSGTFDGGSSLLTIWSGSYALSGGSVNVSQIQIPILLSTLERDITPDELITRLEDTLFVSHRLPSETRSRLVQFLQTDDVWNPALFLPQNTTQQSKKIRALIAIMLAQPEFILQMGVEIPQTSVSSNISPVSSSNSHLIFVELPGGYDWLHGIIPKNEYATYVSKRTTGTGTIALTLDRLTDIGDFYMNNSIAYGSGWAASLKSLLDSGNLRVLNRVGTTEHSRDHDAAQKQIASYHNITDMEDDGVFGHLVKASPHSIDAISLGNRQPNVFRGGSFANIGPGGGMLSNSYISASGSQAQFLALRDIFGARTYPAITADIFKTALTIDAVATESNRRTPGLTGAGYGQKNNLKFLDSLLSADVGKAFYIQADGGYDTHSAQLAPQSNFSDNNAPKDLNYNIGRVMEDFTDFFNRNKANKDITIVIFSEFGRTIATNGDLGTDHWEGGGMFVISNNSSLLSSLPEKVYGKISLLGSKENWLGAAIDYRSVYSKVLSALYGIDPVGYFWWAYTIENDVWGTAPRFTFLRKEYKANDNTRVHLDIKTNIAGASYQAKYESFVRMQTGTGESSLKAIDPWWMDYGGVVSASWALVRSSDWNTEKTSQAFAIQARGKQYALAAYTGAFTLPDVIPNTINTPSYTSDSILRKYENISVNGETALADSGILLASTASGALTGAVISWAAVTILTGTGNTYIPTIFASGSTKWNGGFILGERVDTGSFISPEAKTISGSTLLDTLPIERMVRIGADTLGVGMKLSQNITLSFTGLVSGNYRVISSEDGVNWSEEVSNISVGSDGILQFPTNHFSYFAIVTIPKPVVVTPPSSGSSGGGGGGGGSSGGGGLIIVSTPVSNTPKTPTECSLTGALSSCVITNSGSSSKNTAKPKLPAFLGGKKPTTLESLLIKAFNFTKLTALKKMNPSEKAAIPEGIAAEISLRADWIVLYILSDATKKDARLKKFVKVISTRMKLSNSVKEKKILKALYFDVQKKLGSR